MGPSITANNQHISYNWYISWVAFFNQDITRLPFTGLLTTYGKKTPVRLLHRADPM